MSAWTGKLGWSGKVLWREVLDDRGNARKVQALQYFVGQLGYGMVDAFQNGNVGPDAGTSRMNVPDWNAPLRLDERADEHRGIFYDFRIGADYENVEFLRPQGH